MEGWVNKKIKTNPQINKALKAWFKKHKIKHDSFPRGEFFYFRGYVYTNKLNITYSTEELGGITYFNSHSHIQLTTDFLKPKIWI